MPWFSLGFVTQDGPSHLYTALVAKDLLFNSDSPYAAFYEFQPKLVTNWCTTVVMNVAALLFGPRDAEHAVATLCVLLGFFGLSYLRRSIDPQTSPWSPVTNFLLFSWFLWIGFYNFYLGMAIVPFVLGYYIRYERDLTWRRVMLLTFALVLLFFTHVLAVSIALLSIGLVAVWSWPLYPRRLLWTTVALLPAVILLLIFIKASGQSADYDSSIAWAWNSFPMHAFAASRGRTGEQAVLMPGMLLFMCIGVLAMRRHEWTSARGPVFVTAGGLFILYLLVPNVGFGGDEIKIRFAWAVFFFGCTAASTVERLQPIRIPVAIYTAIFVAATLIHTLKVNVWSVAPAASAYLAAMEKIPPGSTFVRLRFSHPGVAKRYGFDTAALEPLFHTDSLAAARRGLIALSDYQALTRLFPVVTRPSISDVNVHRLWDLEGTGATSIQSLRDLLDDQSIRIDYIVVVGDEPNPDALQLLESTGRLIAGAEPDSFIRIYQRSLVR
jgi:hypothetical protein